MGKVSDFPVAGPVALGKPLAEGRCCNSTAGVPRSLGMQARIIPGYPVSMMGKRSTPISTSASFHQLPHVTSILLLAACGTVAVKHLTATERRAGRKLDIEYSHELELEKNGRRRRNAGRAERGGIAVRH